MPPVAIGAVHVLPTAISSLMLCAVQTLSPEQHLLIVDNSTNTYMCTKNVPRMQHMWCQGYTPLSGVKINKNTIYFEIYMVHVLLEFIKMHQNFITLKMGNMS